MSATNFSDYQSYNQGQVTSTFLNKPVDDKAMCQEETASEHKHDASAIVEIDAVSYLLDEATSEPAPFISYR